MQLLERRRGLAPWLLVLMLVAAGCPPEPTADDDDATGDDDDDSAWGDDDDATGDDDDDDDSAGDDDTDPIVEEVVFPDTGIEGFRVQSLAGAVTVTAGVPGELSLLSRSFDPEGRGADALGLGVELTEGILVIDLPEGPAQVDLEVSAPAAMSWSLDAAAADISIVGMEGAGVVTSGEGSVGGFELGGDLWVSSEAGPVDIDSLFPSGTSIEITAASGDVTLSLPLETAATLQASAPEGEVVITDIPFDGWHGGSQVSGLLGEGEGAREVMLEAGTGTIRIQPR